MIRLVITRAVHSIIVVEPRDEIGRGLATATISAPHQPVRAEDGIDVDLQSRAIDRDGQVAEALFVAGARHFGELPGRRIWRVTPETSHSASASSLMLSAPH